MRHTRSHVRQALPSTSPIRFQRDAQQLGAVSETTADLHYFLRRFADDRPLPRAGAPRRPDLLGGQKRCELNLCEGATLLARRLQMPDAVAVARGQLLERWDGKGLPGEAAGEEISRPLRIVRVAQDLVTVEVFA